MIYGDCHSLISCATVQLSTFYEVWLVLFSPFIIIFHPRIQAEIREAEKENVARQKQVSYKSFRDSVHLNAVSYSTFFQPHSFPRHMRSWIRGYMSMTSVWHQNQKSLYRWASQIWIWILSRPMYCKSENICVVNFHVRNFRVKNLEADVQRKIFNTEISYTWHVAASF